MKILGVEQAFPRRPRWLTARADSAVVGRRPAHGQRILPAAVLAPEASVAVAVEGGATDSALILPKTVN